MEDWKQLSCQYNGQNFLVSFSAANGDSYEMKVSDLDNVWQESLSPTEAEDRCKRLNPRLEVSLTSVMEHIQNALKSEEINTLSVIASHDATSQLKLEMHNDLASGIPFQWEFLCNISNDELCRNVFLLPISRLIMSLQVANNKLIDIIHKKDDEIKDYKEFSGATVSRPYLETQQFDRKIFGENLRRSQEYQDAIKKDVLSILTLKSVHDKAVEIEKDISSPMSILGSDVKGRTSQAKPRTRNRRRNVRAPAKGVEIESDQEDSSQEHAAHLKTVSKRTSNTDAPKTHNKKKGTNKRKKLF